MSISGEIDRIRNNVQNTLGTIAETGVNVAAGANSNALPAAAAALANEKQNKLTGVAGQVVGFDANGNAIAQDAPAGGGVSSWNDLTDKPTVMVGGDTLTWDGDITGKVSIEMPDLQGVFVVQISDATPSINDFSNGCTVTILGTERNIASSDISEVYGVIGETNGYFLIVADDNTELSGVVFPKKGTYVIYAGDLYVESLTIPGYTGFTKEIIKQDALPEALRFGKKLVDVEYLPETTLEFSEDNGAYVTQCPDVPVEGKTYKVNWNGTEYNTICRCEVTPYVTVAMLGNAILAGMPDAVDTGEPFCAMFMMGTVMFGTAPGSSTDPVTVSVYGPKEITVKLSDEFYDGKTTFYLSSASGDKYVYKDTACTVKATKADVVQAVRNTAIDLAAGFYAEVGLEFRYSVLFVDATENYAELKTFSGGSVEKYYTAEYTGS